MAENSNAIIILNYNDWNTTASLVKKIEKYSNISYIIVVDNASTDESVDQLKKICNKKVKLCISDCNKGYAYGNNLGCEYAITNYGVNYITIANPDIYFTEETLERILEEFQKHEENVGIVGCHMICHSNIDLPSAWKLPTYTDCILENLMLLRRIIGNRTRYDISYNADSPLLVDVIAGSFFTISSEAFKKTGGFDTETFLYYEENILSKKLNNIGYRNYLIPNIQYDHYHSVSINKTIKTKAKRFKEAQKSREYYAIKYLQIGLIRLLFLRIVFYIGLLNYTIVDFLHGLFKNKENTFYSY